MKEIPITRGLKAFVDDADYEALSAYRWYAHKGKCTWYARRDYSREDGTKVKVFMHRAILSGVATVDHVNGNGLDNRRSNLRAATRSQNSQNAQGHRDGSSKYKGVSWDSERQKWCVRVGRVYAGRFDSEVEAAEAYNTAAVARFGKFARLNEIAK